MKQKTFYFLILSLLAGTALRAQEQFTKKINSSFDHVRLDSVLYALAATQTDLKVTTTPAMEHIFITLQFKDITLDKAIDLVLAKQSMYHDYEITKYSEHYNNLSLLKGKATER
ncbi:MAG: hypothetical protein JSU01_02105, partial [Bacteroidetes bacterium]|nr:hypothetical protein [Bacteroidota bacterium]